MTPSTSNGSLMKEDRDLALAQVWIVARRLLVNTYITVPLVAGAFVMNEFFRKFAHKTSEIVGSPWAFIAAVLLVIGWATTGPYFGWSDSHSLVINTITTIITFLMVFVIQNSQNRDAKAIQLKLDELLRAVGKARTGMIDVEDLSDEELKRLQEEFRRLHERHGDELQHGLEALEDELEDREEETTSSREPNG
jgi:low affinity Fe/Cu permease